MKKKIIGLLFAGMAAAGTASGAACSNETPAAGPEDLSVITPTFEVANNEGRSMVTTLGKLKNASPTCLTDIVVEVMYFDEKKNLIDAVTQPAYGVVVPAGQEVAFRVREPAARPKADYASQSVRVVSADRLAGTSTHARKATSPFVDFLVGWGPMLLLIGVWVFFMQRMKHKDSPQQRTIALIVEQNAILAAQGQLLSRLAVAAEAHVPGRPAA